MSEERGTSSWASRGNVAITQTRAAFGGLAMAALAAVALGATVFVAQRGLADASNVVVRGEADAMLNAIAADLAREKPPNAALFTRELSAHREQGLRYVALIEPNGARVLEAGDAQLQAVHLRPGDATIRDGRVRVGLMLPPAPPPDMAPPDFGFGPPPPPAPPMLVVEVEPPMIRTLRAHLARVSIVAAVAAAVLIAFALAWNRSARRLAAIEQRAAREQRLVALGSMSSVMAHELRNPLASLKGHAQLLVEDLEEGKLRKKAERVVSEAERLEALTTSLLDFVRDGPIDRRELTTRDLVDHALVGLDRARVDVDVERAPKSVRVDGERLARAVHNLIDNALQASTERVELAIAHEGGAVVIRVRDHGPGLPKGGEAQLFEPFVTTRVRGTGLGLPVARRIAEQHRGTLEGENARDGGALFTLRFPLDPESSSA